jgi:DNA-binding HxlR family transcriptional regulator
MHPEVPPRVEYELTPLGATLRELVNELMAWSGAHLAEVDAARARYDARAKQPQWAASDV